MPQTLDMTRNDRRYEIVATPTIFEQRHSNALAFAVTQWGGIRTGWLAELSLPEPGSQYDLGRRFLKAIAEGQGAARYVITRPGLFEAESNGERIFFRVYPSGSNHEIGILEGKWTALDLLRQANRPPGASDDWVAIIAPSAVIPAPLLEYSPGLLCGCGHWYSEHSKGVVTVCRDRDCPCDAFAPAEDLPVAGAELDDDDDDDAREEALDRAEAAADGYGLPRDNRPEFVTAFGQNLIRITLICACGHSENIHEDADDRGRRRCPACRLNGACPAFLVSAENTIMADVNARWLRVAPPTVQALATPPVAVQQGLRALCSCGHLHMHHRGPDHGGRCHDCGCGGFRVPAPGATAPQRDEWGLLKKVTAATKNVTPAPKTAPPPEIADSVELRDAYERFGLLELDDRPAKGPKR